MNHKRASIFLVFFMFILVGTSSQAADEVDIPFESFRLDNGLRVIVHEDHKAPVVAVNIWYHVGSKDEKPGRTGFAHLFEHLMFNGTENYDDEYFGPFEKVGATDMNGTTWLDRTNYFQNVPSTAVDLALWMESDRMGHLLGAITQEKLDEQRGVVQNEKRQRANRPYGKAFEEIQRSSFPEGHPYRWTTIGSMEDLNAASLEDVHEWFKTWYGAANAVLVLAGDITVEQAREKVEKYFGHIPAGPTYTHRKKWVAKRTASTRSRMFDQVPQTRLYRVWNAPGYGTNEAFQLDLAAGILGSGKNSRLYKRLVYQDQIATSVSASFLEFELAGLFYITADVKPGVDPAVVEQTIDEELALFLKRGPNKKELERVKTSMRSGFIRGVEKVGGFSGKAQILAQNAVYLDDPGAYKTRLTETMAATPRSVLATSKAWLSSGDYNLEVLPFPKTTVAEAQVDRTSGPPEINDMPELNFPTVQRSTLSNGIEVLLAERHSVPVVNVEMIFDAGYAADSGKILGTASFTSSMLDEGTKKRSALEIAAEAEMLGANISADASLDSSTVSLSALKDKLTESMDLYADIIKNPVFDEKEIERLRSRWLANIKREKSDPYSMALRVLPPLLYGEGHDYAIPLTGSGTEESIASLQAADLKEHHASWLRPEMASIVVAGDTSMDEILPMLEKHFGKWSSNAEMPAPKNIARVSSREKPVVYLMDKPGAVQSYIFAGLLGPEETSDETLAFETMNDVIGGSFTARLNMNLREDKGWAYGARSSSPSAKGQKPWLARAPVQTDKTAPAMQEMLMEINGMTGDNPPKAEEIEKIRKREIRSLPGRYETTGSVGSALAGIVVYDRPDDYIMTYKQRLLALADEDVKAMADKYLNSNALTWVVVGDLEKIEQEVRDLGLGDVHIIDQDGKVLR